MLHGYFRTMEELQQDLCMPREHEVPLRTESHSEDDHSSKCSVHYWNVMHGYFYRTTFFRLYIYIYDTGVTIP